MSIPASPSEPTTTGSSSSLPSRIEPGRRAARAGVAGSATASVRLLRHSGSPCEVEPSPSGAGSAACDSIVRPIHGGRERRIARRQSSRSAVATGSRAARIAGKRPPISPISSA